MRYLWDGRIAGTGHAVTAVVAERAGRAYICYWYPAGAQAGYRYDWVAVAALDGMQDMARYEVEDLEPALLAFMRATPQLYV